jgi:glycosyltransferase involved in cell wall biosynthesis
MGQVISEPYYLHILSEARGDHRFLVLPPQEKGVVAAAMEQADLLLLPSQAEVFDRVVLEAMSHRLPWIASTNCSGLKEVKGGSLAQLECEFDRGVISPKKRGKAVQGVGLLKSPFVEEIRRLLSDPVERERMGEEGRQEWKGNYRWQNFAGRYLDAIGLTPDPSRTAFFRRNTIEPEPARPDFIEFLRAEKRELPLVSVVLITYNRPELLKTAIGSVLDQTYEDFEVVVVNDGGPDISQIIEQFDDPRIIYIHNHRNMGPSGARNVAISMSRGKYIAYLDDDDIYYPTHLEALVDAVESSEGQVAYTDSYAVTMVREDGRWCRKSKDLLYSEDFDRDFLFAYNIVPIICVMHDTKLFVDAGGFDEDLRCLEDWDLWIRMAMLCDFKHVREITCEVSHRMDRSRRSHDIQGDVAVVTRAINGKYDGQVYRARDMVNKDIQSLLRRLETMKNYSLTDALSYLEDCLETYTESPRLEHMCAQIYRGQKDWGKTKYHLERCLKLDPGNKQASEDLAEASRELRESGGKAVSAPGLSDREIDEAPEGESLEVPRQIPIIVPVMGSGEDARAILAQLYTVTDNYSLVIVNNGLRDSDYLEGLDPRHCIETPIDMGTAGSINQALELLSEEYIAVLRSDVLLYDEGWLENIVDFLRRRKDVGLVGIAGWHSITEEGAPDLLTPVFKLRGHPDSNKPTWRFTEVAAIDDAGWVMRNAGFKLSEDYCDTSLFALDLSLKYIEAGFRVYVAAVEFAYAEDREDIARRFALAQTDHGEDMYGMREEARLAMRTKWEGLLPLTRGFYDEAYVMNKVEELADIRKHYLNIQRHARNLEADLHSRVEEIEKITRHARKLEVDIAAKDDAVKHITEHERQLERALATSRTARLKNFVRRRLGKEPLKGK